VTVAVIALAVALAAIALTLAIVAMFARRFWLDREEMRVQGKAFVGLIGKAVENTKELSGWGDFALRAWQEARDEAVRWRGRKEPF
jgi:hypothetical protein